MKKKKTLRLLVLVTMTVLLATSAWAGGLYNYEVGSDDTGLASAGYASRAQDASTLFTNPAGMTRLDQSQLSVAAAAWYLGTKFSPNSNTSASNLTVPDGTAAARGNASQLIPAGGLFSVFKLSDKFAAGFGVFAFFGGPTQYADNSVMRYHCIESLLQGITVMPSLAFKISDKFSVGAGLNAMYSQLDNKVAVNNRTILNPTAPDGQIEIQDNEWGYGGKFGVLFQPTKETRFGATYLTQTKMDFSATPTKTDITRPLLDALIGNRNINATMRAPQQVIVSGYHDLTDSVAVMADLGWENWANFGQVTIQVNDFPPGGITTTTHYSNTWHVAVGTQIKPSDPWKISFGFAYDSSMCDGVSRSPSLPIGQQWRFATGAQHVISPTMTLSAAYEYIWSGDLPMDVQGGPLSGRIAGQFDDVYMQVFNVILNWKF